MIWLILLFSCRTDVVFDGTLVGNAGSGKGKLVVEDGVYKIMSSGNVVVGNTGADVEDLHQEEAEVLEEGGEGVVDEEEIAVEIATIIVVLEVITIILPF